MQESKKILILSIIICITYLVSGVLDLRYYGPNWDEPVHFGRGHAIVYFLLTGKKNYKDFGEVSDRKRSYYQSNAYTVEYFDEKFREGIIPIIGAGHPPISDVLSASSNIFLYQKLKVLGDIESHHFFSVLVASLFVASLFYFVSSEYNIFAGLVTVFAITLYPLFLGESRYNTKDVPEAVFYGVAALLFYKGIIANKIRWIMFSALFFALAFGTKFNILFLPFTFIPWLLIYYWQYIKTEGVSKFIKINKHIFLSLVLFPLFSLFLLYVFWPLLWTDTINRFFSNFLYYKSVGILDSTNPQHFNLFGINLYAPIYILFITPLTTLLFTFIGVLYATFFGWKEKHKFSLFVLFWFLLPIVRVMIPHTNIYGGVRQIMEYIPAMAVLAGIGATYIVKLLNGYIVQLLKKRKQFSNLAIKRLSISLQVLVILSFIPITLKIISVHPNQSIYFNPLIGGLIGARAQGIPGWGNSLGSTYRQGVLWLNEHAEPNAKLAFVYELRSNIARSDLRSDIELDNQIRSGLEQRGEYIIGVTHDSTRERSFHRIYLERFLYPVYMVEVEGVPVLKVWKNDRAHTKPRYQKDQEKNENVSLVKQKSQLFIDLNEVVRLTKIEINYKTFDCSLPKDGYFELSYDGKDWESTDGDFSSFPLSLLTNTQPKPGFLQFWFPGDRVRYIRVVINDKNSCLLKNQAEVTVFKI